MGVEIERKFLVQGDSWRSQAVGIPYSQGYLVAEAGKSVRVRIAGEQGYITIKGPTDGLVRSEFEYSIPVGDARIILKTLCYQPIIEKTRYRLPMGDLVWEIDEFFGENQGLIVAEVELNDPNQAIVPPAWLGEEVSGDPRYFNASLALHPYRQWGSPPPMESMGKP